MDEGYLAEGETIELKDVPAFIDHLKERISQLESENAALKAEASKRDRDDLDETELRLIAHKSTEGAMDKLAKERDALRARLDRAEKALKEIADGPYQECYHDVTANRYFEESK